jgi:aminoglycoside 3-N-acetyltransferase I
MTSPIYELAVLSSGNLSLMRELNALFGKAFDEVDTYSGEPPDDSYLTKFLSRPHVVVIVALEAGAVIGGLVAYALEKFERRRSEFYIYDLAVDAAHRRRGVASGCIERLKAIARERGGSVIFVQADPPDAPAIALYQKFGVAEHVLHFDLPL